MALFIYSPYSLPAVIPCVLIVFLLRKIILRVRARSIARLPGPPPGPWLVGNLPDILRPKSAAESEFAWTNSYGTTMRVKGAFGIDILLTADPKAMQYILNTGGYSFPKAQQNRATSGLVGGKGISWAQGAQHARHRKVMNPAFSYSALRDFLPLFRETTQRTVTKWKDLIAQNASSGTVLDIPSWLARTTLDIIGEAAFDYKFGALDEDDNELSGVYKNLFSDSFFNRSDFTIAFEALWGHLPLRMVDMIHKLPTKQLIRLRDYMKIAKRVAKTIVDTQSQSYSTGKEGGKDVMSILVRANLSEDPKAKLGEEEVLAQLTTLMIGGHETTASTVTWVLYELSKHLEIQSRVREEIKATRAQVELRGDSELSIADLDSMKCLLAVMKETLRYHPIFALLNRVAGRDDLIPLSKPITTKTGKVVTVVPITRGQRIMISIAAYNRLKTVWGDDADAWRPERFLEDVERIQKTGLGVVANLATFSSGLRNCVGWRFAMIELQAILIELLENFEFSPAPDNPEIIRAATNIMVPIVKGSQGRTELPLMVTPVV